MNRRSALLILLAAMATTAIPVGASSKDREPANDNVPTYHGNAERSGSFVVPGLT